LSLITVWLCNFWQKTIGAKADRKMLMKLTADKLLTLFTCFENRDQLKNALLNSTVEAGNFFSHTSDLAKFWHISHIILQIKCNIERFLLDPIHRDV